MPSAAAGPAKLEGALRRCFTHSAEGAVFAAVNIAIGSHYSKDVIEAQFTEGPVRDQALAAQAEHGGTTTANVQLAGFLQTKATAERSEVLLVMEVGERKLAVVPEVLVWTGDDWAIDGSGSDQLAPPYEVPNLTGYIPWSGVK